MKTNENIYNVLSADFNTFSRKLFLTVLVHESSQRGGDGVEWLFGFFRLRFGDYLVLGAEPGTQIHQLAPPGAKRKKPFLFGYCPN